MDDSLNLILDTGVNLLVLDTGVNLSYNLVGVESERESKVYPMQTTREYDLQISYTSN